MNRDLSHPASRGRPASHDQTRAVYALIDRIRAARPGIEIESCSSGGGRADYEILKRTDRIWTSDCHDPIERQPTQAGFSIFFPPELMGAHVGSSPDHTTRRRTSLAMRAITALFGHMGVEADVRSFSERELADLAHWIDIHKQRRRLIHGGRLRRLEATDPGAAALMVSDERAALVAYAQLETPAAALLAPLRPVGLARDARYRLRRLFPPAGGDPRESPAFAEGASVTLSGREIEAVGIPLPHLRAGEAALFELDRRP
jgi:alpha-galactosidase